ncbi:MAG: hypothetical protein WAK01_07130 [Methylocystis sp.]
MGATAGSLANDDLQSMADALRDAATATVDQASDQAAKVGQTVTNQGSHALRGLSRFAYSSSYVFAYAIVYPALFVAYSLPQDNPVMHGLRDGGRAAKDSVKSEQ